MGGGYSLDLARLDPTLAATVINYGHLVTDPAELKKIHAPILGNFGAQDQGITPDDVHKFEQQLKSLGKNVDISKSILTPAMPSKTRITRTAIGLRTPPTPGSAS